MPLFARRLLLDQHGKATNFRLHTLQFPHMRALHFAWLSFMVAFIAWYAIPPIVYDMSVDLGLTSMDIFNSNMAVVSITIVARLVVGPLCERYGPRRVMAGILVCGAIPCGLTGLITNGAGLIALRAVIGILGATFVPCQFWTTQMFAPSVVGTANAISAGWGNMGGGITYLLMPTIYECIHSFASNAVAWRVTFIVPTIICLIVAALDYFCSTDTPNGDWLELRRADQQRDSKWASGIDARSSTDEEEIDLGKGHHNHNTIYPADVATITTTAAASNERTMLAEEDGESIEDVKRDETVKEACIGFFRTLCKPPVLIMIAHYACSFGTELAVDNVIGQVFREEHNMDNSTASYIGSIFGLLNIVSRLSGGIFSDFMSEQFHVSGRILAHCICMILEGIFLIGFGRGLDNLPTAIMTLVFFSFFVQVVCGTSFGIVPFIDPPNSGKVIGIVGAGGNFGGLIFSLMFREYGHDWKGAFVCLGSVALGTGLLGNALLSVQGKMLWHCFNGKHKA
ncbi:major facilitator superfamily domain-containing protein [Zychaea mexicana]|uniref:major facilitator superfamily domain-containing protein n=1 Tax=Zychaea mexicana TaxID=64656 RepID=UPI0022FEF9F7|nr:major facilitator superfamily domain-containing protein [Zychaea mexicana]KAI9496941.1 major facilitator superfamily domain-containing protein [Zychaea mexicana]